jgi:hypothetical protein
MNAFAQTVRRVILRNGAAAEQAPEAMPAHPRPTEAPALEASPVEIAPNDPIVAFFQSALRRSRHRDTEPDPPRLPACSGIVVPLVKQG